jgi:hypothetical protein
VTRKRRFDHKASLEGSGYTELAPRTTTRDVLTVQIVETRPGGECVVLESFTENGFAAARRAAERAQELADAQCLPHRVFILDRAGVRIFAAGQLDISPDSRRDESATNHGRIL